MSTQQGEKTAAEVAPDIVPQSDEANGFARAQRAHVAVSSGDLVEIQVEKLRRLFPEVFVEGKIDFDKLRTTLGSAADSGPGRFHFSWAGKDDAITLLQTPSRGTLVSS